VSGHGLSVAHAAQLAAGGIRADVIAARGYWTATATDLEEIRRLGHSPEIVASGDALMLPLHDVYGMVPFTVARPDVPRCDARGRPRKYESPRSSGTALDVPPMARPALADAEVPLWVTEGQKKADAILSAGAACVVAVPGVWGWKGKAMAAWESLKLRDRTAYLAFDSDTETNSTVTTAARRLKAFLRSRGAHVRIVYLAPGQDGRKVGIDDALAAGATLTELAGNSGETLRAPVRAEDNRRPELDVSNLGNLRVKAEAYAHLRTAGVYQTGQGLVRVANDDGALVLRRLAVPDIRAMLDRAARCVRRSDDGVTGVLPPRDLAEVLAHDPDPAVAPLRAVVTCPTFTREGRLLDTPGYDVRTGLLVAIGWTPRPVPAAPTVEDLAEARRCWDAEALVDFPFASEVDRTQAMALALTPLVREMIDGPTPLHSIEAPGAGAGKGKVATACLTPSLGPGGWAQAAMPREDEELRKQITAHMIERRGAVLFDNVRAPVRSAVLAKALTGSVWDDRLLGRSEGVRAPIRCTWAMTANNPRGSLGEPRHNAPKLVLRKSSQGLRTDVPFRPQGQRRSGSRDLIGGFDYGNEVVAPHHEVNGLQLGAQFCVGLASGVHPPGALLDARDSLVSVPKQADIGCHDHPSIDAGYRGPWKRSRGPSI
jgi:hypothetical protein